MAGSTGSRHALIVFLAALTAIVFVSYMSGERGGVISEAKETSHEGGEKNEIDSAEHSSSPYNPWKDSAPQWIMAAFAVIGAGISWWAVILVRDTLELNRVATKAATDAALEAARTNEIARRHAEIQTRAYMAIGNISVSGLIPGSRALLSFKVKNVGQSPAYKFQIAHTVEVADSPSMTTFRYGEPLWDGPSVDVFSAGEMPHAIDLGTVEAATCAQIMSGEKALLFWGALRYRSIFGRMHRTTFCAVLDHRNLENGEGSFVPTTRHNRSS